MKFQPGQADVTQDGSEDIVEVVGNAPRQGSQGLQVAQPQPLFFGPLDLGDIAHIFNDSLYLARGAVDQRKGLNFNKALGSVSRMFLLSD